MIQNPGLLGELEIAIMNILWEANQPLDVSKVVKRLGGTRAYTTVMTTMQRLHAKGHLHRVKGGRSFLYSARLTQQNVLLKMLHRIADQLFHGDTRKLIDSIMGIDGATTDQQHARLFHKRIKGQNER